MTAYLTKVILPMLAIGFMLALCWQICNVNGKTDYFLLWILVGCPFGIRRMFVWVIPRGYDLSGTIGIWAMNFVVGGMIGGFVVVYRIIYALGYTLKSCVGLVKRRI